METTFCYDVERLSSTPSKMYHEQSFNFPAMSGLSEKQISEHIKLYAGYVKNTNVLLEKIADFKKDAEKNAHTLSELKRRFAFEWNGMRMHEYYFEALGGNGSPEGEVVKKLEDDFGSFNSWLAEFKAIGLMRGVGWAALVFDEKTGALENIWVSDHEIGHLAGTKVLVVMDVWEHAYLIDYPPSGRKDYIEAFFRNLNWQTIDKRLHESKH